MLRGLDCSNHQETIDWPQVAASGKVFAFIKASESRGYIDAYHAANIAGARAAGLTVGSYHFARPSVSTPEAEAAHFLAVVGGLLPGDMLALDMEDTDVPTGRDLRDWCLAWLRAVETATGVRPILYSGLWYMEPHGLLTGELSQYPLWLAAYRDTPPPVPAPWSALTFWQRSNAGSVPGVNGNCDLNAFFGDEAGLRAMGKQAGAPDLTQDWQTVINVTRGWSNQMAQASRELSDVADILERLRS